jgi:hypothetical protein
MMVLNADQQALLDFQRAVAPLREAAREFRGPGLVSYADAVLGSASVFGLAERHARQRERAEALGVQPQRARFADEESSRLNDKALKTLGLAPGALQQLRKDLAEYADATGKANYDEFHADFRAGLVDADVKTSDLQEVDGALGELLDAVRSGGADALVDRLEAEVKNLDQMRRSPGRGAERNIAPWKIASIILMLGIGVINFIHCTFFGCSVTDWGGYIAAYGTLGLIALAC